MATIIMAISSSFAGKAAILAPPTSNNIFQGCVTMRKTIAKPRLVISASVQSPDKSAQPVPKSKNPFRKIKPSTGKSKQSGRKPTVKRTSKYLSFRKFLLSIHREIPKSGHLESNTRVRKKSGRRINRRFFIRSRKQIHYKKIRVIGRFIGYQGKIIPRRVTRLSMTNQRLMTAAIKKARILGLLPFTENEKHIKRVRWKNVINRRRTKRGRKTRRDQAPKRPYPPRT